MYHTPQPQVNVRHLRALPIQCVVGKQPLTEPQSTKLRIPGGCGGAIISALRRLRQEDPEFEASLGCLGPSADLVDPQSSLVFHQQKSLNSSICKLGS
jgi:hypothetical protein